EARDLLKRYKEHIVKAELERNYYNKNMKLTEQQDENYLVTGGKADYCSVDATAHYSYDWAQNIHIPHSDQQVSKIYYLSPHKVHLFGIQDEAVCKQINYVLDENYSWHRNYYGITVPKLRFSIRIVFKINSQIY